MTQALQKADKPKRIPASVKKAVNLLENGEAKTITDAAAMVGVSREFVSRTLGKVHVQDWLQARAKRKLALAVGRAAVVKVNLLECESSHVRNDAATDILAMAGLGPKQEPLLTINNGPVGYIIKLKGAPSLGAVVDAAAEVGRDGPL